MLPGDVALFRPHNTVGRVIASVTMARFCHARLIIDQAGNTVEADFGGAIRGRVEPGDVIVSPPLTLEQRAAIPSIAAPLVGTPYGWADIIALGAAQLGVRHLPRFVRARLARTDRLFCSQLVDIAWQRAGYRAFDDGRTPLDVSPGDIADLAFTHEWPTTTARS